MAFLDKKVFALEVDNYSICEASCNFPMISQPRGRPRYAQSMCSGAFVSVVSHNSVLAVVGTYMNLGPKWSPIAAMYSAARPMEQPGNYY